MDYNTHSRALGNNSQSLGNNSFPIMLTYNQRETSETVCKLLAGYKILVIKGEPLTGKNLVARDVINKMAANMIEFDLCEACKHLPHILTNQDIQNYLEDLSIRFNSLITSNKRQKRSLDNDDAVVEEFNNLSLNSNHPYNIIYIRNYYRVHEILCEYHSPLKNLLAMIIRNFTEKMPAHMRILMTSQYYTGFEGISWHCTLLNEIKDVNEILGYLCQQNVIKIEIIPEILKLSKKISIGKLLNCINYATTLTPSNAESLTSNDNVINKYTEALRTFSGSTVDIEKDVPILLPEEDLIGIEDIMDEINTSIINPMKLGISGISIKRGLLLCGPPGTGKTSIGRWLAHQIKGKFYLIGGEIGINGSSFIDYFETTMKRANDNSPAVVFIDDCDVLFSHDDTYRAFLTILDGIDSNKRSDVCVMITCMNLKSIPASLIRGGRLEMVLITKLPNSVYINKLIEKSFIKMGNNLREYNEVFGNRGTDTFGNRDANTFGNSDTFGNDILQNVNANLVKSLSIKMVGWNCADIHRCFNDVTRLIAANKGDNLTELFEKCIMQIREQYRLCGAFESTTKESRTDDYIM